MIRIKKSKNGQFYFVIIAKNGQVLCTSETYTRKSNCKNGITAVKALFFNQPFVEIIDETKK